MDPQRNHVSRDDLRSETEAPSSSSSSSSSAHTGRDAPDQRQPRYLGGFSVIPPNEDRRREMTTMAQKEEEELQRLRETNRVTHVHMESEKLGGHMTLGEVRQKQQINLCSSKWQKKLRQKELERKKKQEEEEDLQKMKDKQRNKSERLQERQRQEEQRRKQQLSQDHFRMNESFLQRLERRTPDPLATSSATHTSSMSESVESKQKKSVKEVQLDHKRVNSAFLDKLGGGSRSVQEAEPSCLSFADLTQPSSSLIGQQSPSSHLKAEPEQSWTQEIDLNLDYEWVVRKLMADFPECSRVFLEDIVNQCHGNYELAHSLLS